MKAQGKADEYLCKCTTLSLSSMQCMEMATPGHAHLIDACEGLKVMGAPMGDANWSKAWLQRNAAGLRWPCGLCAVRASSRVLRSIDQIFDI